MKPIHTWLLAIIAVVVVACGGVFLSFANEWRIREKQGAEALSVFGGPLKEPAPFVHNATKK